MSKRLGMAIRDESYMPGGLRKVTVKETYPDGVKERTLHLPNLVDRIAARAVNHVLVPIYEPHLHENNFGFRPRISPHHAILKLEKLMKDTGRTFLQKIDVSKAFDRVPHGRALDVFGRRIKGRKLIALIEKFIRRGCWKNLDDKTNVGLAMGDPLSPLVFNIYMDHNFDQKLAKNYPNIIWIRWADDILLLCESEWQAREHVKVCEELLRPAGMTVNETKTHGDEAKADLGRGQTVEYLGMNIGWDRRRKRLKLHVPDTAWWNLWHQIVCDIEDRTQMPMSNTDAQGAAISTMIEWRMAGWLEAYSSGITPGELGRTRARMREVLNAVYMHRPGNINPTAWDHAKRTRPTGILIGDLWR